MTSLKVNILSLALLSAFTVAAQAQYSLQEAFPGLPSFSLPLEMRSPSDGTSRLFVVEQRGRIYVFENGPTVTSRKEFLNLSDRVSQTGSETGLLGLAFHPNYRNNGYFYVNYTSTLGGQLRSIIARYQVSPTNPDSALKNSEQGLIIVDQPFQNHNGGNLLFGLDGYLYASFGDGGSAGDPQNNAQNRSTLLGKILRINVDSAASGLNYSIPPTNPFYGNVRGFREEIYAYGLRNPWKMSFEPLTGKLWAADVGQDTWEEIDIIESGGNYGWRIMEGNSCYNPPSGCDTTGLTKPIWTYNHSNGDASITGGYVYRGSRIAPLVGKYVYGDYMSGRIWALTYDGVHPATNQLLIDSPYLISSFGEDVQHDIYVLSYQGGRVYRLLGPTTSVKSTDPSPPIQYRLEQNYPNPFNPRTTISFSIPLSGFTTLKVYDMLGRGVATLIDGELPAGEHRAVFIGSGLPSGVYCYRLSVTPSTSRDLTPISNRDGQSGSFLETRKLVLLR